MTKFLQKKSSIQRTMLRRQTCGAPSQKEVIDFEGVIEKEESQKGPSKWLILGRMST